jgi:hypothetical protein
VLLPPQPRHSPDQSALCTLCDQMDQGPTAGVAVTQATQPASLGAGAPCPLTASAPVLSQRASSCCTRHPWGFPWQAPSSAPHCCHQPPPFLADQCPAVTTTLATTGCVAAQGQGHRLTGGRLRLQQGMEAWLFNWFVDEASRPCCDLNHAPCQAACTCSSGAVVLLRGPSHPLLWQLLQVTTS